MKSALCAFGFFALTLLPVLAQEPVAIKRPPLSATKATWVNYAGQLETLVTARDAQIEAEKLDTSRLQSILSAVVSIDAKLSAPAQLAVAPIITSQPVSMAAKAGSSARFSVAATGDALTYQWWRNGVAFAGWRSAELALDGITTNDAGSYTVVITGAGGSVTSEPAALTIGEPDTVPTPPVVAPANPDDASVGSTVTFIATADGNPAPTFTWRKNGVLIPGATGATLTLTAVTAADSGSYVAIASNDAGQAESPVVKLNVVPSP